MPLVVKFADTQKEKEAKKTQPSSTGVTAPIVVAPTNGSFNNAAAYLQVYDLV